MAKSVKKAPKRRSAVRPSPRDGAPVDVREMPIVALLRETAGHLAWLRWLGRQFSQDLEVSIHDPEGPPPPMPGSCGLPAASFTLGDIAGLVAEAEQEVRTVIERLVGEPVRPGRMPERESPRPGAGYGRRR